LSSKIKIKIKKKKREGKDEFRGGRGGKKKKKEKKVNQVLFGIYKKQDKRKKSSTRQLVPLLIGISLRYLCGEPPRICLFVLFTFLLFLIQNIGYLVS